MSKLMVIFVAALTSLLAATVLSAEVAVIANPSVPVKQLSSSELLDLYTGDVKEWQNGEPIIVLDLKPKSNLKEAFYDYLGKSSSRMKSIWMKNMLSGEGRPPQAEASEEDVVAKVSKTPGAIGYVNRRLVTPDVVVLVVIPFEDE